MRKLGPLARLAATTWIGSVLALGTAEAGKVHWKEVVPAGGCFALAFDDTDQWFANPQGFAFKKGVCFGQAVRYKVVLAPDQESFTVSGAQTCRFHVGDEHRIELMGCSSQAR